MKYKRVKSDELQFFAEREELENYFNKVLRQILHDEIPELLEEVGKKDWLTRQELEELTGWSERTIQHLRYQRKIPYSQHGRKIVYPRKGILEFLNDNLVERRRNV